MRRLSIVPRLGLTSSRRLSIPPPPSSGLGSVSPGVPTTERRHDQVFTADKLVPFVPSFFTPMDLVLESMPGYTSEHIKQYFGKTAGVQTVELQGRQFVRLHGNFGVPNMSDTPLTNARFSDYKPDPKLFTTFLDQMQPGRWMSIASVLSSAPPDAVKALPFQGAYALIFFSQFQHKISFKIEPGAGPTLLRHEKNDSFLLPNTTPLPLVANEICRVTFGQPADLDSIFLELGDGYKQEILDYYVTEEHFMRQHGQFFDFNHQSRIVTNRIDAKRAKRQSLPLEEQKAQLLKDHRHMGKVRAINRRLLRETNPETPYLDAAVLKKALHDFLPQKGHVQVNKLVKALPQEMQFALPKNLTKMFKNSPDLFTIFEYKVANVLHVQRAGQELPPGAINLDAAVSDEMILKSILSFFNTTKAVKANYILGSMPAAVRDTVKRRHKGLGSFLLKYPENFTLTVPQQEGSTWNVNESSVWITLVKRPKIEGR